MTSVTRWWPGTARAGRGTGRGAERSGPAREARAAREASEPRAGRRSRRVAVLLAAAGLLAGVGLSATAAPARADGASMRFRAADRYYIPTANSAPGGDHRFQFEFVATSGQGDNVPVHDVKIAIDVSALAGKVTVGDLGYGCTAGGTDGLVVTCDRGDVNGLDSLTLPLTITPLASAPIGFAADITLTATASDAPSATRVMHAVIGLPHLVTQKLPQVKDLPPGGVASFTPIFGNTGEVTTTHGFQVLFDGSSSLELGGPRYSNCHYSADRSGAFWCQFDQDIAPGTAYTLDRQLSYITTERSMISTVSYLMFPTDTQDSVDLLDPVAGPGYPLTGTGPVLGLTPSTTDGLTEPTGGFGILSDEEADFQAVGGAIKGKPGDVVMLPLGVRNAGPGGFDFIGENPGGGFDVTMPKGVTVLSVFEPDPDGESQEWMCSPGKNAPVYHCKILIPLEVGAVWQFRFQIRIDRAVRGAVGQVKVVPPTKYSIHDTHPADDVAPITVDVAGGTGGATSGGSAGSTAGSTAGSASGSASAGASGGAASASGGIATGGGPASGGTSAGTASGGTQPSGGRLAATGAGGTTLLAGLGAAALLAGGAATAIVAARRRRA
ncbi:hypothetical protein VSR01_22780 [Actinacidiphila sp. DG2A-62]|uniref:hypothetical protein n=1 Tax=Actinacidiphila sp. DG2A-62 TaxID=3108821 RepID=UPI002DB8D407|nr:hypothetical protein [Actinacidiphila sp. DG2A-62]MEC3996187.1 hypothetical protein [Actinacidiphila sp. DG2A-62]